jgi:hypothetical protein
MRDAGPAVTGHPDPLTIHAAVQLAAATVLLHEGVEGGEEIGQSLFTSRRRNSDDGPLRSHKVDFASSRHDDLVLSCWTRIRLRPEVR